MLPHKEEISLSKIQKIVLPLLLAISIFMQMLDVTILNTALPAIASDFNQPVMTMQSAVVSYVLTVAVCIPLTGYLSDRFGTQRMYSLAMLLFGAGSLLCALSSNLFTLVLSRVVQGLGGALLTPVARLVLMRSFQGPELLNVLNYAVMPALIGPLLGPLLGGVLVEKASWHWIFLMNLPFAAIAIFLSFWLMPNFTQPSNRLDILGVIVLGGGAFLITLGVELTGTDLPLWWSVLIIFSSVFLFLGYRWHAYHYPQAIYPLHLWHVRTYRVGLNSNLLTRLGVASIPLLLPLLFQVVFSYSPLEAAWLLVPMAIAAIIAKPLLPYVLRFFGYKRVLLWNTLLIGTLLIGLSFFSIQTPKKIIAIHLFFLGMANSIQFTAINTLTVADLRPYQKSSANSLMAMNQQLAMGLGTALGAMLVRFNQYIFSGWEHNLYRAFQSTFLLLGAITIVTGWWFRYLHRRDGEQMAKATGPQAKN